MGIDNALEGDCAETSSTKEGRDSYSYLQRTYGFTSGEKNMNYHHHKFLSVFLEKALGSGIDTYLPDRTGPGHETTGPVVSLVGSEGISTSSHMETPAYTQGLVEGSRLAELCLDHRWVDSRALTGVHAIEIPQECRALCLVSPPRWEKSIILVVGQSPMELGWSQMWGRIVG